MTCNLVVMKRQNGSIILIGRSQLSVTLGLNVGYALASYYSQLRVILFLDQLLFMGDFNCTTIVWFCPNYEKCCLCQCQFKLTTNLLNY